MFRNRCSVSKVSQKHKCIVCDSIVYSNRHYYMVSIDRHSFREKIYIVNPPWIYSFRSCMPIPIYQEMNESPIRKLRSSSVITKLIGKKRKKKLLPSYETNMHE
uniref:Uncharacterized protein n=1 Tax=Rhizophora mucronata TaxID=61149 RepID=A0A2P2QPC8_RHIMU